VAARPGAEFVTPEVVLVFSAGGLGELSDAYHRLFRERLASGPWRDRVRPIVINNWEATYFNFDEPKLLAIASAAHDLGIELFVLDDGWFGRRNDDTTPWATGRSTFPSCPAGWIRWPARWKTSGCALASGSSPRWSVATEPVRPASGMGNRHPDAPAHGSRNQYVLDMSRPEVVNHLFGVVSQILGSAPSPT